MSAPKGPFERFRQWTQGSTPASSTAAGRAAGARSADEHVDRSREILQELDASVPLATRIKLVRELAEVVKVYRLQEIGSIWAAVASIAVDAGPLGSEARVAVFTFVLELLEGQLDTLPEIVLMDMAAMACNGASLDELLLRTKVLQRLTKDGRDMLVGGRSLPTTLLSWLWLLVHVDVAKRRAMHAEVKAVTELLTNLVKSNFYAFEVGQVEGMISAFAALCVRPSSHADIASALSFMDTLVRYGSVPTGSLPVFVQSLCRAVNHERHCQDAYNIAKHLLNGQLAFMTMRVLCETLEDPDNRAVTGLLRGAVFLMGMASWGSQRVSRNLSFAALLPSLLQAAQWHVQAVDHELVLSLSRLVNKYGRELSAVEWDVVLDLLSALRSYLGSAHTDDGSGLEAAADTLATTPAAALPQAAQSPLTAAPAIATSPTAASSPTTAMHTGAPSLEKGTHAMPIGQVYEGILLRIEELIGTDQFAGSPGQFFDILEMMRLRLPEPLMLHLLNRRIDAIHPGLPTWIEDVEDLVVAFYKGNERPRVRLRVLSALQSIFASTREIHAEPFIEHVIIGCLSPMLISPLPRARAATLIAAGDTSRPPLTPDAEVGAAAEQSVADSDVDFVALQLVIGVTTHCTDAALFQQLIDILVQCIDHSNPETSRGAVEGLITVFKAALFMSAPGLARLVFAQIMRYVGVASVSATARLELLRCLLMLRADASGRLYFFSNGSAAQARRTEDATARSHFVMCAGMPSATDESLLPVPQYLALLAKLLPSPPSPGTPTAPAPPAPFAMVLLLLQQLPAQISDKVLFGGCDAEVRDFVGALCKAIDGNALVDKSEGAQQTGSAAKVDTYAHAFQLLSVMVGYKQHLLKSQQDEMVKCFEQGLSRWHSTAKICIHALTICSLEIPSSVRKMLPSILAKFAQISSNHALSLHLLEFLSAAIHTPELYVNFVEKDYKILFGLALQFIAARPLKDKPQVAKAVKEGAAAAGDKKKVDTPTTATAAATPKPEDRKVDHSAAVLARYGHELAYRVMAAWFIGLRFQERRKYVSFITNGILHASAENPAGMDERAEVMFDIMARHAYANLQSKPTRSFVAEQLLADATTRSWLHNSSVVSLSVGRSGWSELTIRRASGTVAYLTRLENKPSLSGESDTLSLAATLMMHWKGGASEDIDEEREVTAAASVTSATPATPAAASTSTTPAKASSATSPPPAKSVATSSPTAAPNTLSAPLSPRTASPSPTASPPPTLTPSAPVPLPRPHSPLAIFPSSGSGGGISFDAPLETPPSLPSLDISIAHPSSSPPPTPHFPPDAHPRRRAGSALRASVGETGSPAASPLLPTLDVSLPPSPTPDMFAVGGRSRAKTFGHGMNPQSPRERLLTVVSPRAEPTKIIAERERPTGAVAGGDALQKPPAPMPLPQAKTASASFHFMQLFTYPGLTDHVPLPLKEGDATVRAINTLDRIPAVDLHKIGVVYVAPGQSSESEMLSNTSGSPRYTRFLQRLGSLLRLRNAADVYTGGLDTTSDFDGEYAYYWQDDVAQVIFHVTTLMPTNPDDSSSWVNKKRHIGNDFVTIVYNDAEHDFSFGTFPGQFDSVNLVVKPLDDHTFQVSMLVKDGIPEFSPLATPKIVSEASIATLVRQVAIHANLMATLNSNPQYVSNFTERLRQVRRMGERLGDVRGGDAQSPTAGVAAAPSPRTLAHVADFTRYA